MHQRFAHLLGAVISVGLVLGLSAPARADVIWAYKGNNFTSAQAPYTTSDSVTVTMILLSPLLPNETNINQFSNIAELIMSDGVQTLDSLNGLQGNFAATVSTDSSGNITNWTVVIDDNPAGRDVLQTYSDLIFGTFDKGTTVINGVTAIGSNTSSPGVWSIVPEPSTALLLVSGLAALAVRLRARAILRRFLRSSFACEGAR